MRSHGIVFSLLACVAVFLFVDSSKAQTPAPAKPPAPATAAAKPAAAAPTVAPRVYGTLAQVMKGILYPASNVVFAAQDVNPNDVPQASDPSVAPNPLASSYGKWEAVENSSIAMAEAANLLSLPGRKCSNGRDVPIHNADWPKFVQGLRDAAMVSLKAAKAKNQDDVLMAADSITTACANCHNKYREKTNLADRCK